MSVPKYSLSSHHHRSLCTLQFCPRQDLKLPFYPNPVTPGTDEYCRFSNHPSVSREGCNVGTNVNFVLTIIFPWNWRKHIKLPVSVGRMPSWKQYAGRHIVLHKQGDLPEVISFQFGNFCDDSDELNSGYPRWKHKHTHTRHWKGAFRWSSGHLVILTCIRESQNVLFTWSQAWEHAISGQTF